MVYKAKVSYAAREWTNRLNRAEAAKRHAAARQHDMLGLDVSKLPEPDQIIYDQDGVCHAVLAGKRTRTRCGLRIRGGTPVKNHKPTGRARRCPSCWFVVEDPCQDR